MSAITHEPQKNLNHLTDWMNAINSKDQNTLRNLYEANAVKIISADNIINGASKIADSYESHKNKIVSVASLFSIKANSQRGITYEIVQYETENQTTYIQLVIWKMVKGKVIREFEFTEKSSTTNRKDILKNITKRRTLWMELCNAHKVEKLVKQLYSAKTMYYNHKPIVQGTENLIQEYGYMNRESYSLQLDPKKSVIVNANFVFEIGQCSGSYGGKYVLIWKKEADGNWRIYIDSNI
jgi:ketosteroid isomerase-like protein